MNKLRGQNIEYANRRDTLRLGPVRTIRLPEGSWLEFQKRRLARSGGTVEQYKQPHLIPDLDAIESFQSVGTRELVNRAPGHGRRPPVSSAWQTREVEAAVARLAPSRPRQLSAQVRLVEVGTLW